jgi:hypothetical protein
VVNVKVGQVWRHKRTGGYYVIVAIANEVADDRQKFPLLVVYQDIVHHHYFTRPPEAFDGVRFEQWRTMSW